MNAPIQLFPGPEGIKQAYQLSLSAPAIDIVCLAKNYDQVIGSYFDKEYSPKLHQSSIVTREILLDTFENRQDSKTKQSPKNQTRFLKTSNPGESDCLLFSNKLMVVSYNPQNPFALVIDDPAIVFNFQSQFSTLWATL